MREIRFDSLARSKQQLSFVFSYDDLRFETAYWYDDVDLYQLEKTHGARQMHKLYFHMMAFEANKLVSLCPQSVDFGDFAEFVTPQFEALWQKIVHHVWAQWRYENDLPFYSGPVFRQRAKKADAAPIEHRPGAVEVLSFCGGGKDSLVAMKLLERAGIPYSTFVYSHSIYGTAQRQHRLVETLLQHAEPVCRHKMWVYDNFIDSPVLQLYPQIGSKNVTAAETPASIFAVLPVVLQHGYRYIALAHERSANTGNLIWEVTGEDVNHQWGKSFAAEKLLNNYIQTELLSDFSYFSVLQPVYDVVIFNMLRSDTGALAATHSCNIEKPWCRRCPKCAYVWLNYMAYLPVELVQSIFQTNLFDLPENIASYRQMLGLTEHTPFECIGQIAETRLAFELCRRKGLSGKAMAIYTQQFPALDIAPILERYLDVRAELTAIPAALLHKILPIMRAEAREAGAYVLRQFETV